MLSASVANALEYHGDRETVKTANFVRLFDKFFDSFNVRSVDESILKRKPDLRPYVTGPMKRALNAAIVKFL